MAYYDHVYAQAEPRKFKNGRKRKPWKAFFYLDGRSIYLGRYETLVEAVQVEHREKLRRQRELLEEYPEEVRHARQQRLL